MLATHLPLDDRERRYAEVFRSHFLPHYERLESGEFSGRDGVPIRYRVSQHADEIASVVLLPGRTESHMKYAETLYDLHQAGFSVYTLDHRGQGFSGRMCEDRELGHVLSFNDYVHDLHTFLTDVVAPRRGNALFFLAHSMGAAIATMYILRYHPPLAGVIFSSPMLRIDFRGIPRPVVQALVSARCALGAGERIAFGTPLEVDTYGADLTRSAARLEQYRSILRSNPLLRLGPPTNLWMKRAIEATNPLLKPAALHAIRAPVLLLEATADSVVRIDANRRFEGVGSWMVRATFPGAFHDLFIETDDVRAKALTMMFLFLRENAKT